MVVMLVNPREIANIDNFSSQVKSAVHQEVRQAFTDDIRTELFRRLHVSGEMSDLEGFENFVYSVGGQVVRVTHESHRTEEQLLGELEFVSMLSEQGASVAAPIRLPGGNFIESLEGYHACLFEQAIGTRIRQPIDDAVITSWGEAIGLFHRLASGFKPRYPRQDWLADDNHQFHERIPAEQELTLARADELMAVLKTLSADPSVFGLIHSDAHPGNFLVDGDKLTFFDFDDCLYAWFGYDLATLVFGIALLAEEEADRIAEVKKFLDLFLSGYEKRHRVEALMLDHMSDLLRLREFSFYGVVHAFMDVNNLEYDTAQRYMTGRQPLLEQGVPLVDLDFSGY